MQGQLDAAQHVSVAVTDAQNRGFHPEPLSESDSDLFRSAEPMLTEAVMHESLKTEMTFSGAFVCAPLRLRPAPPGLLYRDSVSFGNF